MLDNSTNEIYLFGRDDLQLLQMNIGAQLNLAVSNIRIKDMSILDIQKDISKHEFTDLTRPLIDGKQTVVLYETTFYRSDATGYPVEVRLQYYKDETPPLFVAIVQDITERKEAERLLQDYQEHLEEMVEDRTNELSVANKELESFCYSVSHDLRAPLRSIDGFSQALMEDFGDELSEDAQDYLRRVRASSLRMGELIDDLLSLSRVVRSEMVYTDVDISSIASSVLSELKDNDRKRKVNFIVQPNLYVQGDGRLLRILLENMLGNAWKFTSRKDHAHIAFGMEIQDGKEVYFVRDNGAGFDESYAHKLFEPFQRLHTADEFEGTGIGLATVRRIVRRHNGDVWAKSKIGEGATVFFTLG
jgi:light-regulated signal transduction histidine kinase (bacteriophytochrome)